MPPQPVTREGSVLWTPSPDRIESSRLRRYQRWLHKTTGVAFEGYPDLWRWSVQELEAFWRSLFEFFEVSIEGSTEPALTSHGMPETHWFPHVKLNYAAAALDAGQQGLAVIYRDEGSSRIELTYDQLRQQVFRARAGLESLGVGQGDRVVAYLPNCPEALIALLATASLGAIWSSCPPEFGVDSVLDRFQQIEPKVLIATDAYSYGGKRFDRSGDLLSIVNQLPTLQATVALQRGDTPIETYGAISWHQLIAGSGEPRFDLVPFEHPLWVLYSSGTTGIPKAIVHGHGGIVLEHLKQLSLHADLGSKSRFFWYSTTGWMMWNYLVSGLLVGATVVLYEGSPSHPNLDRLFHLAEEEEISYLGISAPLIQACLKAERRPGDCFDLERLEAIGSTGAPLSVEGFEWVYSAVKKDLLLASISGGTDVCTAFVGSAPTRSVHAGEIQALSLGADVAAFDESGRAVSNQVGELVIRSPMPSMPVFFWGDADGKRYRESYFETFDGVWCHGDWIKIDEQGRSIIYGRSDSTLNRGGVRMGTSEFYRVIDSLPEIVDSVVVDTGMLGSEGRLWLFVVLEEGQDLDEDLIARIRRRLRTRLSPRHSPDEIRQISEVPTTLSGKKLEIPIRRILTGTPLDKAVNPGTLANPEALESLISVARG
ncbi:MAG: acetoacetate--CoA ligase [Acidobacteriota bacterium]